jgi:choline dehydrogenase-like flavoprotein
MEGMLAIAGILYVTGAEEIHCAISGFLPFVRSGKVGNEDEDEDGINNVKFQDWLASLRKTGLKDPGVVFATAHQIGTCRMGIRERNSVVDSLGKVCGTESLYV